LQSNTGTPDEHWHGEITTQLRKQLTESFFGVV
jgi:hypothetical protein